MVDYVVYADLNCPFSYALYETLSSYNLLHRVEWRLVEHHQEMGSYLGSAESMAELASDVFSIRSRVPEVSISLPMNRGDSYFPTLCVIAAQLINPEQAQTFLRSMYRALWVEGKESGNPSVIFHCLEEAGLPTEIETDELCEEILTRWQGEWEGGNFGLRTPAILASDGRKLVGLLNRESVSAFLDGEDITPTELTSGSRLQERMTIALYGGEAVAELWSVLASLRDDSNILLPQSLMALSELIMSDDRCPDLVLLHNDGQATNLIEQCRELSHLMREKQIPLAVIGEPLSDNQEAELYDAGISDYLHQSREASIIQARLNILLQLKRSHDLLARAASIDNLTQVFNRREFERTFETEWRRGQRSRLPISLILLDIDHFKAFNDSLGHLYGDQCLKQIAQAIKGCARRAQDIVSRYGGEEFCLLAPETDQAGALVLAENIQQKIAELNIRHSDNVNNGAAVTASLGIATLMPSQKGVSPRLLLEQADTALYQAKDAGRNQARCYEADAQ